MFSLFVWLLVDDTEEDRHEVLSLDSLLSDKQRRSVDAMATPGCFCRLLSMSATVVACCDSVFELIAWLQLACID